MLPETGKIMKKWSIIRSLHHHDAGHSTGDQICFTGYDAGSTPDENIHPSIGSIVSKQIGHQNPKMPPYVMIPRQVPGTGSAYLGVAHKPFETIADPANKGPFKLPNFERPAGVTLEQIGDRARPQQPHRRLRLDPPAGHLVRRHRPHRSFDGPLLRFDPHRNQGRHPVGRDGHVEGPSATRTRGTRRRRRSSTTSSTSSGISTTPSTRSGKANTAG